MAVKYFVAYSMFDMEECYKRAAEFEGEISKQYPIKKLLNSVRPKGILVEDMADILSEEAEKLGIELEGMVTGYRSGIPDATMFIKNENDWKVIRNKGRELGILR